MSTRQRNYDSTVARIAGNLLSGMTRIDDEHDGRAVVWAVGIARKIVAQTQRTEPATADARDPAQERE